MTLKYVNPQKNIRLEIYANPKINKKMFFKGKEREGKKKFRWFEYKHQNKGVEQQSTKKNRGEENEGKGQRK